MAALKNNMVVITEVTATYSRTVQIEEYEPLKISETLTGSVEEDETPEEAYDTLYEEARESVERKITHRLAAKRMDDGRNDE